MATINTLRVLLVNGNRSELERISTLLEEDHHAVLPIEDLLGASEAIELQRFDAVLLTGDIPARDLAEFTGRLRTLERNQRTPSRASILSCSSGMDETEVRLNGNGAAPQIDAYLSDHFKPSAFAQAIETLADRVSKPDPAATDESADVASVFDSDAFQEQLGFDNELIVDILGLFLEEHVSQVDEMEAALRNGDFPLLSRVAHTIKGSLATFHAERARLRSQQLEIAAKNAERRSCEILLPELREDLKLLTPKLSEMQLSIS